MKRWITVLCWIPYLVFGQSLDSLKIACRQTIISADRSSAPCLDQLAKAYYQNGNYDSALIFYRKLIRVNHTFDNTASLAASENDLGVTFYKLGQFDSCIFYYKSALAKYVALDDTLHQASLELNLAIIYKDRGRHDDALRLALKSSTKLETLGEEATLASAYNTVALIYAKLNNLSYALSFHHKALQVRRELGHEKGVGQSLNNIGNTFRLLHNYDSALHYYTRALEVKRNAKDVGGTASTLNNLGDVLVALKRLQEAKSYYEESLLLKQEQQDQQGQAITLNNLAHVEILKNNLSGAKIYLKQAEEIAERMGLLEDLNYNYELWVKLLRGSRQYELAALYSDKLLKVRDSLLTKEKAERLAEIQTQYETERKEQRILLLEQEQALQQNAIRAREYLIASLIGGSVLIVLIALLVLNQYRLAQRQRKATEMLLQELHHRVKNNLQILSSVLGLQSQYLTDKHAIQAVKSSESRVSAMALIHRKLYGGTQNRTVNIKEYLDELCTYLLHTYGIQQGDVNLTLEIQELKLDVDTAIPLGLILNELISNALKYATQDNEQFRLSVRLQRVNNRLISIQIADNGQGLPVDFDISKSPSFGLKMVNMLVAEMKGNLQVATMDGTKYELIIPITHE